MIHNCSSSSSLAKTSLIDNYEQPLIFTMITVYYETILRNTKCIDKAYDNNKCSLSVKPCVQIPYVLSTYLLCYISFPLSFYIPVSLPSVWYSFNCYLYMGYDLIHQDVWTHGMKLMLAHCKRLWGSRKK